MASIADIFGPSPEELAYAKRQEEEQQARKEYLTRLASAGEGLGMFAGVARAGVRQGEQLRRLKLFGEAPSPAMEKATEIRQILQSMSGEDLNDPDTLLKISKELGNRGYPNEALQLADRARQINRDKQTDELNKLQKEAAIAEKLAKTSKAARGKALSDKLLGETEDAAKALNETEWLSANFDDSFTGFANNPLGEYSISLEKIDPTSNELEKAKVEWWLKYEERKNNIRKELFGSAFTATEAAQFAKFTVTPWMDPGKARDYLKKQAEAARSAYVKNIVRLKSQGKDISGLAEMAESLGIDTAGIEDMIENGTISSLLLKGESTPSSQNVRDEVMQSNEWKIDRVVD